MARTKYGYLHIYYGRDMDGSSRTFSWVRDEPQSFGMTAEQLAEYHAHYGTTEEPGWFALCEIEPEAGWIGPFETVDEATAAATTEDGFASYMYAEGYEYRGEDDSSSG